MGDFLARLAERLSDLGVTAGLGSAVPAGPGVQKTTVRLTRGTSARAYRLLYGQAVSLADAGLARGAKPPTLVFTSFMTPRSAQALLEGGARGLGRWCTPTWSPAVTLGCEPSQGNGGTALLGLTNAPEGFLRPLAPT